jgi:hypothetical protein
MDNKILIAVIALMLVSIVGCIYVLPVVNAHKPVPTPEPTATPTPTAMPTIMPTPTAIANASDDISNSSKGNLVPAPWSGENYDEYIRELEKFYNVSDTPRENRTFPDPIQFQMMLNLTVLSNNTGYVPGHPETANGTLIFIPTPIPSPTPVPTPTPNPYYMEKHTELRDADAHYLVPNPDHTGTTPYILAYDAAHSHGIYPYYYKEDVTAIQLRFVNNQYKKNITKEHVDLVLQKQILGQFVTVKELSFDYNYFIPEVYVDQYEGNTDVSRLPGFMTEVISFEIPKEYEFGSLKVDTHGNYVLNIYIYADDILACKISQDVCII